jgi:hypothetical protein
MTSLWLRIAMAAVRAWTRLYTWRMAPPVGEARCAEIESDLWEHLNAENGDPTIPLKIIGRVILGIPDDVRWRMEHVSSRPRYLRRTIAFTIGSAAVLAFLWVGSTARRVDPPQPPVAPRFPLRRVQALPPPPPPPPPICNPPGSGRPAFSPCTPF